MQYLQSLFNGGRRFESRCHDFNFGSQVVDRDTQLSILVSFGCHPDTIRKLLIGIPRVQIPPASC